jgi:hypothetical protein
MSLAFLQFALNNMCSQDPADREFDPSGLFRRTTAEETNVPRPQTPNLPSHHRSRFKGLLSSAHVVLQGLIRLRKPRASQPPSSKPPFTSAYLLRHASPYGDC